jgi:hypothetical protein
MDSSSSKTSIQNSMLKVADLMCLNDHPEAFETCKGVIILFSHNYFDL